MKIWKMGMLSLLAAALSGTAMALSFETMVEQAAAETAAVAQQASAASQAPAGPVGPQAAVTLTCKFYPNGGAEAEMVVPVNLSRRRAPQARLSAPMGGLTVTLVSNGGDGGEGGSIKLAIVKGSTVVYSVLWQAGDNIGLAGQSTGLQSINSKPGDASSAELQFSCTTK